MDDIEITTSISNTKTEKSLEKQMLFKNGIFSHAMSLANIQ